MEAPLPSSASMASVATPLFPGFFPKDTNSYQQDEPPLDAAGRSIPPTSIGEAAAPALLGAAAGFIAGGIPGALTGAGLFSASQIESQGLAARNIDLDSAAINKPSTTSTSTTPSAFTAPALLDEQPTEHIALGTSAIAKEVGGDSIPAAVLAGGAGGGLLDHVQPPVETAPEVSDAAGLPAEEPVVGESQHGNDDVLLGAGAGVGAGLAAGALTDHYLSKTTGFPASDITAVSSAPINAPILPSPMSSRAPSPAPLATTTAPETVETPVEESVDPKKSNKDLLLGAGAGAGAGLLAGGIGGHELSEPRNIASPTPPFASSSATPSTASQIPSTTPAPTAAATEKQIPVHAAAPIADSTGTPVKQPVQATPAQQPVPEKLAHKDALIGAGAGAGAGLLAGDLADHEIYGSKPDDLDINTIPPPPPSELTEPISHDFAAAVDPASTGTNEKSIESVPMVPENHIAEQELIPPVEEQPEATSGNHMTEKELAGGALGAGTLMAMEEGRQQNNVVMNESSAGASTRTLHGVQGVVSPQDDAEIAPAGNVNTLDSRLSALETTGNTSRFYENLDSPPVRPEPQSHFSEFTTDTASTDTATTAGETPFEEPLSNPFEAQRVTLPRAKAEALTDISAPRRISIADLDFVKKTAPIGKPAIIQDGFVTFEGEQPTLASREFAALTNAEKPSPVLISDGFVTREGEEPTQAQREFAALSTTSSPPRSPLVGGSGFASPRRTSIARGTPTDTPSRSPTVKDQSRFPPPSPAPTATSTRAVRGSPTVSPGGSTSDLGDGNDLGGSGVIFSPHMKIATRKDSIGHNKLVKEGSLGRQASQRAPNSPNPSSPRAASPIHNGSTRERSNSNGRTAGESIWMDSVANVVNDETAVRGQRPGLVTIDSEDRRDHFMTNLSGVPDPTYPSSPSRLSRAPPVASPDSPKQGSARKLRRGSNASSRNRSMDFDNEESQKKEGFWSKAFGKSPRSSMDEQRR